MKLTRPDSMPQIVDMLVGMGMTFDLTLFGDGLSVASPGHVGANPAYGRAMRAARDNWGAFTAELFRRLDAVGDKCLADPDGGDVWARGLLDHLFALSMTFDFFGGDDATDRGLRVHGPAAPDAATAQMYQHAIKSARKRWPRVVAEIHRRHNEASMRDFADKRRLKCEIGTLVDFLVSKGMTFRIVGTDTLQVADPERGTTDLIYHEAMKVAVNNWDALGVELRRRLAVKS